MNVATKIRQWGLRAGLTTLTLFILLLILRVYFALTPAVLAPETLAILAQANRLPTDTENGLRQFGLLAPKGEDPVAYGRCMLQVAREHRSATTDVDDATHSERQRACAKGPPPLAAPPEMPRIQLKTSTEEWQQLEQMHIDPTLQERFEAVMGGGPRYLGRDFLDPFTENFGTLQYLHRATTARVGRQWIDGQHDQAARRWRESNAAWSGFAQESLVSAMLAVAAQTQNLLSIQRALREGSAELSERDRVQLLEALEPIDRMPDATAQSMMAEWIFMTSALDSVEETGKRLSGPFLKFGYDHNDTINITAANLISARSEIQRHAKGQTVPSVPLRMYCAGWEGIIATRVCPLLTRNPLGRILASMHIPAYASYGTRVADLRNLAAATRLMIQLRGLHADPDSMGRMNNEAPEDMRDVFTKKPFDIDPVKRILRVQLREKSTFLGAPGPYELGLWP